MAEVRRLSAKCLQFFRRARICSFATNNVVFGCITKIATKNIVFARKPRQILISRQNSVCWGLEFCSSQNFLANTVRLSPQLVLRWWRPFLNAALKYENHRFRRLLVRLDLKLGGSEFSVAYLLIKRSGWGLVGSWLGRRSDRAGFLLTMGMVG